VIPFLFPLGSFSSQPPPAHPFRATGTSSLLWTHGSSFGGGGTLTSDNHNSLYTRATVSLPCLPRCFALLVFVWTYHFLFLSLLVFSHRFFTMSFPSSLFPFSPDHPVASTTAIPQLFSTFLALVAVAGEFRVPFTYCTWISFLFFLSFLFSRSFTSSLSSLYNLALQVGIYFLSYRTFLRVPLHSLSFSKWASEFMRRNWWLRRRNNIERPTATCRAIYKPPFSSFSNWFDSSVSLSLVLLRSIFLPFLHIFFLFQCLSFSLLLRYFSHCK